jgi:hypothetical protein
MTQLDPNYNADLLDAMADIAYEQEQAMRESSQDDWNYSDQNVAYSYSNYGSIDELNPPEPETYDDQT